MAQMPILAATVWEHSTNIRTIGIDPDSFNVLSSKKPGPQLDYVPEM